MFDIREKYILCEQKGNLQLVKAEGETIVSTVRVSVPHTHEANTHCNAFWHLYLSVFILYLNSQESSNA
jgi:hypothetical protein